MDHVKYTGGRLYIIMFDDEVPVVFDREKIKNLKSKVEKKHSIYAESGNELFINKKNEKGNFADNIIQSEFKRERNLRSVGTKYENIAVSYLKKSGYNVIDKNYRCRSGEIDIICVDQFGTVVFTEVKYRENEKCGDPLEAVDFRKQQQIIKTALYFMMKNPLLSEKQFRFDVIGITGESCLIKHIENAFELSF